MKRFITMSFMLLAGGVWAQEPFSYHPSGKLFPGSGEGHEDDAVYLPEMHFPLEEAPAYANSQVWGVGGSYGPDGHGHCDGRNYSYPWWDNYCETRDKWRMPRCPAGKGHQGQDIRPRTCTKGVHWAVAVEAGTITKIGPYSVSLRGASNIQHRYLHLEPSTLAVKVGDQVAPGQRIGRVSDASDDLTTIHLHFDMRLTREYISPYMSLVRSYERLLGADGIALARSLRRRN